MAAPAQPRADPSVRRRGAVYGIPVLPVDADGRVVPGPPVVGYIGKTRQTVKQREDQHRADQPFGDLIIGGSWCIEEGTWDEAELDAHEQHYIRNGAMLIPGGKPLRPVYNYDYNQGNPGRIEIWRAVQHRQVREPGWTQARIPRQRGAASAYVAAPQSALARWWVRRRWHVAGVGALWVGLFAALLWAAWDHLSGGHLLGAAAGAASAPFVAVQAEIWRRRIRNWWRRTTRPSRRRRRR